MRIEPLHIENLTNLIRDYREQGQAIMEYFDYGIMDYEERVTEIKERSYNRDSLANVLGELNEEWGASKATLENIERLKMKNSVVVVGGQQAGLLTGPLYSVNKVISIIQLARQQEKKLGIPVIPVFWIAGEDHDFEEINHVYMGKSSIKKIKVKERNIDKRSVSQMDFNRDDVRDWLATVMEQISETNNTKEIKNTIIDCLEKSNTYVDFFARLLFCLFPNEGLVLIDSGNDQVRKLESDYFVKMLEKQNDIGTGVHTSFKALEAKGYTISLDIAPENGNLFYHKDNERILLFKNPEGNWVGKQNEVVLTTEELLHIAKQSPEKLSNNVITRPLMQDLLFPTLAFIGGPGEISYWSVLKPAFHALSIKMPPVVPRLSFTYMGRKIEKLLQKYEIPIEEAINWGVIPTREMWFKAKVNPPIEETTTRIKALIEEAHKPLRLIAKEVRADLKDLADKNLNYLMQDIAFLEKRIIKALEERYHQELTDFSLLENVIHPGGLQERIWNPLPFVNAYGLDFFAKVASNDCPFHEKHFIVYI